MIIDPGEIFSAKHREPYDERFLKSGIPMASLCFNNRFAWSLDKYYYFNILEDLACLYCEGEQGITSKHIVLPLGDISPDALRKIADHYYPEFKAEGLPLRMMYVPDSLLETVCGIEGYEAVVVHKTDYDEYVYDAASLIDLRGKALKAKKNQLNHFHRDCNVCAYHTLTPADMDECLKLAEEWCISKGVDKMDVMNSDYIPIRIIFENFGKLRIRGGLLRLYNKVIAFSIGSEPLDGTGFVHFEKADQTIAGTNVAVISKVTSNEYSDVRYINREEDMGIEGLRNAKKSLEPVFMTAKNDVFLTKKGG